MNLEPEIVERVKRYKRGNILARLVVLAPILFEDVAFLTLVTVWTATRTGSCACPPAAPAARSGSGCSS